MSVLPVNIFLQPGQKATTLTVTNQGSNSTAIQIRAYAWSQKDGEDELTASDDVVVSPPIATIAAGATQVVRLILRQQAAGQEGTYRILVDQIPPPAEPGIVHIVLRLSIPVFAQPTVRAASHVQFHVERKDGKLFLVGVNDGNSHDVIRDIALTTTDKVKLMGESGASPYILAGATRRWPIALPASQPPPAASQPVPTAAQPPAAVPQPVPATVPQPLPAASQSVPTVESFQLTAHSTSGAIAQQVSAVAGP